MELRKACDNNSSAISTKAVQRCFWKQLVEENKDALVAQLLEKMSYIFDEQEVKLAQTILDALSEKQEGVEKSVLADQTGYKRTEINKIIGELRKEADVAQINDLVRFRSGFVRESWKKHHRGR